MREVDRRLVRVEERQINMPSPALLVRVARLEDELEDIVELLEEAVADRYNAATAAADRRTFRVELGAQQRELTVLKRDLENLISRSRRYREDRAGDLYDGDRGFGGRSE